MLDVRKPKPTFTEIPYTKLLTFPRSVLPQVLHLLSVQCQAVPQRPRIRQAPTRAQRHRVRGARQRHPELRRARAPAANLRRPFRRQDRRPAAQVAASPAAPVHRSRSQSRLPLRHLDPAGRVLIDPGARPAGARPPILRTGHPREPRSGPSGAGAIDLQSQDYPQDARTVPHPRPDNARHPVL